MKYFTLILILCILSIYPSVGQSVFTVPHYYTQSDFLGTSPGVSGDASGAYFNPAVFGILQSPEVGFYWNDLNRKPGQLKNWALQIAVPSLGFSVQRWTADSEISPSVYNEMSFTDYNIGLGFGDRSATVGIGYSWTRGDIPIEYERDNILSAGILSRPCRLASMGIVGHYSLNKGDLRGIADLGIRPFGSRFMTLFTDAALTDYQRLRDIEWGAGMAIQPAPGIEIFGKYFKGGEQEDAFLMGIALTLGGAKISYIPHYDNNGNFDYNTYGMRLRQKPSEDLITGVVMKDRFNLKMKFNRGIKYQRYKLFDTGDYTLKELIDTFEQVQNDPKVHGVVLCITEDMWSSWELIWEVREKLLELKEAGKSVIVFFERGGMGHYYLASVADKIMIDPECLTTMMGFNLGRTYYKNAADKLGIGVDELRFFKYKSAVEVFSRTSMSEGDREQRRALVDGWYEIYRADICKSRGLTEAEFDHIVDDVSILTADSLIYYNLADTIGRWEEFEDWVNELDGKNRKMISDEFLSNMQPLDEEWGEPPQVAVIYALGECAMNSGITANKLRNVIKRAREDDNIKAVVFRADSPGGDILPSDIVAEELKKTAEEKPVIVSQGWVAGSGGYWISMYGDKIVASPWTITGSIGVIGLSLYDDGFGEKIGFSYDNVQRGKHADVVRGIRIPLLGELPHRSFTAEERASIERLIKFWYRSFVSKVAEGRGMEYDEVHKIAQGRVWTGVKGKEIGLVDELGGLEKSVRMALREAGIDPESRWEIVEMPEKGLLDPSMFAPKLLGLKGPIYDMLTTEDPELMYYRMLAQSAMPLAIMSPEFFIEYQAFGF